MTQRYQTFIDLIFGVQDSESGRDKSPLLKAFFEGWMDENCPKKDDLQRGYYDESARRLVHFADKLDILAAEIRNDFLSQNSDEMTF